MSTFPKRWQKRPSVKFFNGFSLTHGEPFFQEYFYSSEYTVAGFSYGAIKAVQYVYNACHRIDTLQLFSPAFFQTHSEAFKRLQLKSYPKNPARYTQTFLTNGFLPCEKKPVELDPHASLEQLHELLFFVWEGAMMESLVSRGIKIEVFLGTEDRIIDVHRVREFFLPYATVTSIRGANHFLQAC